MQVPPRVLSPGNHGVCRPPGHHIVICSRDTTRRACCRRDTTEHAIAGTPPNMLSPRNHRICCCRDTTEYAVAGYHRICCRREPLRMLSPGHHIISCHRDTTKYAVAGKPHSILSSGNGRVCCRGKQPRNVNDTKTHSRDRVYFRLIKTIHPMAAI